MEYTMVPPIAVIDVRRAARQKLRRPARNQENAHEKFFQTCITMSLSMES